MAKDPNIQFWADLVKQDTKQRMLSEDASDADILQNVFSSLLRFVSGEGDKILKDDEWLNYIINDINSAVGKKLWTPEADDRKYLQMLNNGQDEEI